ncbi:Aldo/keto reductase [Irpex rosettiformis]|uniref:Aldo/keto reductase n=1 Tax=Irpex rosettiformis TaxID=378272 RepID=A0ACB8UA49_9APHY|nr:Aldo/keto reductase [Irpex rosettiformis]
MFDSSVDSSATELIISSVIPLMSGHSLPVLGLGVYQNDECFDSCMTAFNAGYRLVDSARYYNNEAQVGKAVRESGVRREKLFVISKIYHPDFGYESALRATDESYEKFGLDYIDLYLIHSPLSGKERRLETWRALIEQRDRGKFKSIGVSNYNIRHIEEIREAGLELPVMNQLEIHPFCQQRAIVKYCGEKNIIVQAYCPLVRGDYNHPTLKDLAIKYQKTIPQLLIRWSLQHGFSSLPKSSNANHIRENSQVFDFKINLDDMAMIDALDRGDQGACQWNPIHAE